MRKLFIEKGMKAEELSSCSLVHFGGNTSSASVLKHTGECYQLFVTVCKIGLTFLRGPAPSEKNHYYPHFGEDLCNSLADLHWSSLLLFIILYHNIIVLKLTTTKLEKSQGWGSCQNDCTCNKPSLAWIQGKMEKWTWHG